MTGNDPTLHHTLEFRTAGLIARLLPLGLLLIFVGLALYVLNDADRHPDNQFGVMLFLAVGAAVTALALWRREQTGKPLFALSPDGIHYRIFAVKAFLIPWSEVKGVETTNINVDLPWYVWLFTPAHSQNSFYFRDVTLVRVSKAFYDETIFVRSFFLRGPGWSYNFIPDGEEVQVALHHELVSVAAETLRAEVEARWRAFRDQPARAPTEVDAQVIALGDDRHGISRWQWTPVALLLLGIGVALANIAGIWRLPGQNEARFARMKAREESRHWEESYQQSLKEGRERDARAKQREKEFDETMKRAFGE